jgi:hypothetical protein
VGFFDLSLRLFNTSIGFLIVPHAPSFLFVLKCKLLPFAM